jgi:hypothetical protein
MPLRPTVLPVTIAAVLMWCASPDGLASATSYMMFNLASRGNSTINGSSAGAYSALGNGFSYLGATTNGNYSSAMVGQDSLFQPRTAAGSLSLSYPSGTASLSQQPLTLSLAAPDASGATLFTLSPDTSLSLSFTYGGSSLRYTIHGGVLDSSNQTPYSLLMAGTIVAQSQAPDTVSYSMVLQSATQIITDRSSGLALENLQAIPAGFVLDAAGEPITIPSVLYDASTPGSVEIKDSVGGGSITFSYAQLYTGPTLVDANATLAFTGAGTLAPSSSLVNNGTVQLAAGTQPLTVTSYTQASGANLVEAIAAGATAPLSVTGQATLAGTLSLSPSSGSYSIGHYTLLDAGSLSGSWSAVQLNGNAPGQLGYALSYANGQAQLNVSPNPGSTQASIDQVASGLSAIDALGMQGLSDGLGSDCGAFGAHRVCTGLGLSFAREAGGWTREATLVLGYGLSPHWRLGLFAGRALGHTGLDGVSLQATRPLLGAMVAWDAREDGSGLSLSASVAENASTLDIARYGSTYSEAASGQTGSRGDALQCMGTYTLPVFQGLRLRPYLGLRLARLGIDGYTETGAAYPLRFNGVQQSTLDALVGLGLEARIGSRWSASLSAGLTHNLLYRSDPVSGGSDIPGLSSFQVAQPGGHYTSRSLGAGLGLRLGHGSSLSLDTSFAQPRLGNFNIASYSLDYTAVI